MSFNLKRSYEAYKCHGTINYTNNHIIFCKHYMRQLCHIRYILQVTTYPMSLHSLENRQTPCLYYVRRVIYLDGFDDDEDEVMMMMIKIMIGLWHYSGVPPTRQFFHWRDTGDDKSKLSDTAMLRDIFLKMFMGVVKKWCMDREEKYWHKDDSIHWVTMMKNFGYN